MKITSEQKMICNLLSFVTSLIILLLLILFFGIVSHAESDHTTSDAPTSFSSDYLVNFLYVNYGFDYRTDFCNTSTFSKYVNDNNIVLPNDFNNSALTTTSINDLKQMIIQVKLPANQTLSNYGSGVLNYSDFNNFSLHYWGSGLYGHFSLGLYYDVDSPLTLGFVDNFLTRYNDANLEPFYFSYLTFTNEGDLDFDPEYYYVGSSFAGLNNYYLSSDQTQTTNLCAASVPVYGYAVSTCDVNNDGYITKNTITDENTGVQTNDYQSFFVNPISDYQLNTTYYASNGGSGGSGNGNDAGTSDNHLVLTDGDWTFNNSSYSAPYSSNINTGSIYPNGNITFSFQPDDYQVDHASDYTIYYQFSFDYSVSYKNWNSNDNPPFYLTNELLNNSKNYTNRFVPLGVSYISQPLSDFINNGNSKSWTFKQAFDYLHESMTSDKTLSDVLLTSKEITSISYNKFNINCTADIRLTSDSTKYSGAITEWYNPMNKKGYTVDNSGKNNNNPYNNNNDSDPDSSNENNTGNNAPGTAGNNGDNSNNVGGGSSSSNATVGNITINNNNTVNANGGNGSSGSGSGENQSAVNFYNSFNPVNLFFNKIVGSNTSTGEELVDTFGANNWITIMSNTFGFMPEAFWSSITVYLVTCIGIVVIAFIIRIILDLL